LLTAASRERRLQSKSYYSMIKRTLRNAGTGTYDVFRLGARKVIYSSTKETFLTAAPAVPAELVIGIGAGDLSRFDEDDLRGRLGTHADLIPDDYVLKRYIVFFGQEGGPFFAFFFNPGVGGYNRLEYPQLLNIEWQVNHRSFTALLHNATVTCRIFENTTRFEYLNQAVGIALELSRGPHDPLSNSQLTFTGDLLQQLELSDADLRVDIIVDLREVYDFIEEYLQQWFNVANRGRAMPDI